MDIVILKGALIHRYSNNATWIDFSTPDTIINIEKDDWSIRELLYSAVNHPDHLPPFWRVTVLLLSNNKGGGL